MVLKRQTIWKGKRPVMRKRLYTKGLLAVMITAAVVSGCRKKNDEQNPSESEGNAVTVEKNKDDIADGRIVNDAVMLTVNDTKVTYSEAMVYVNMIHDKYEPSLTEYIWDFKVDGDKTFEDLAKEEIINQIIRLKIMHDQAQKQNVMLTADEEIEVEDGAASFLLGISMEDQKKYGINHDIVRTIYEDNYLAGKLFNVVTMDVDTVVSDEEARCVNLKQFCAIYHGKGKNGKSYNGTGSDIQDALKRANTAYEKIFTNNVDFVSYASSYSDKDKVNIVVSRGELSKDLEEAVFALKNGEKTNVIEGTDGYYFFYCNNSSDTSGARNRKEEIIKERQDEEFEKLYDEWLNASEVTIVTDLWNRIKFNE